jgi:Zn finger protein HypA/HybF involved in hydrogenase expression
VIIMVAALAASLALAQALRSPAAGISAVTPPNPHGRFKGECGLCHGAEGWTPAHISPRFNHAKFGFALDGAHAAAACRACHATLDFSQEKTQCVGCHQDVHQGELGADCARCHTPRSFIDRAAMVRAHQLTRFPLSGAHASLDCESCHPPAVPGHLQFVGTSPNCAGCHMPDYRATTTPDHVAANFPTTCQNCHSNIAWRPASFDHDRTAFPLTGAHRSTPCLSCHGDGVYVGKSTACVSCHQADYNGTTDPAHSAAGFSTACQTCHNTTSWAGATFDHDGLYFPIYSGTHAGRWSACSDCHNSPSSYLQFTCFTCHAQATTDSHHTGVSGYSYDSNACYRCHPKGRS